MEAERLEIKDKAPMVLAELLYDDNILIEIPKYRSLFLRVSLKTGLFTRFEELSGLYAYNKYVTINLSCRGILYNYFIMSLFL